MKQISTPTFLNLVLRGAMAGLVGLTLLVVLLCQGCGSERKVIAHEKKHNVYGIQKKRSNTESRRLNDYYNNKQHEKYQNKSYY
jgi:hypothetical protein